MISFPKLSDLSPEVARGGENVESKGKKSSCYHSYDGPGAKLWNSLSPGLKPHVDMGDFKKELKHVSKREQVCKCILRLYSNLEYSTVCL